MRLAPGTDNVTPWPSGGRAAWRMLNRPRPIHWRMVRIACLVLLVVYAVIGWLRHDPGHVEFLYIRGGVTFLALLGAVLAPHFGWSGLRAFTVGIALLLPLGTAYINGVLGDALPELALTALSTFIPLVFLRTASDLVLVAAGLMAGHAALLATFPPVGVPLVTAAIVIGSAMTAGAVVGLIVIVYRVSMAESAAWWREACARERVLREFAELTASHLTQASLLDDVAEHLRAAFGEGRCTVVLADEDGTFRVAAAAGFTPAQREALVRAPLAPALAEIMARVLAKRQPVVRETISDAERAGMAERWQRPLTARSLVALPITVGELAAGAVILSSVSPRPVDRDALLVWQAMAQQAGVALANVHLLARLQHALNTKSEFLNTMSHELRSPLHVIVGYADMLLEDPDMDPRHAAERIRKSTLELLQLVENTMNVTRLDARKVTLHAETFAVGDLVAELAEAVGALPEGKHGVPVHWEVGPALGPVHFDRLKLKEIVQNLITNALKFTPEGSVRVHIAQQGEQLRITVRDTGVGIPAEAQARIFEMFERVEQGTGTRPPGAGLGLYIVRSLVTLMHGEIAVTSQPGHGTCFTVHLPVVLPVAA